MDPFNRRSSAFSRKPVQRRSLRLSDDGSEDEDSYDMAAVAVADGFRPRDLAPADGSTSSATNDFAVASPTSSQARLLSQYPSHEQAPNSPTSNPPPAVPVRPSSAIKPPRPHDSLTLRNDGSTSIQTGPPLSSTPESSAGAPQIRPQSPYRGPTGPSHPYQMYPQRTLSNATSSTNQPGNRGPAHPYALYPQNIVASGDEAHHQIPVGFTASGDGYRRQIGPDGEEAGALVGPLGHTEELPPYTRYPDQSFAAKSPTTTTQEEDAVADTPTESITGAGGIGVATRNPEFSSTEEDLQPTQSRPSTRSHDDINATAQNDAEKPLMNKWQRRAKKKLWGIVPYWAICMLFIGVILIGIILGAVIGTVLSKHKQSHSSGSYGYPPPPPSLPADVKPLTTVPPGLPRLPFGNYELPPLVTNWTSKTCFNNSKQASAWSCNMPFSYYEMNIDPSDSREATKGYNLTLKAVDPSDAQFLWGTQPPKIISQTMMLVNDTFEPRRGPAWWLKVTYDKTVIVAEDNLTYKFKRWDNLGDPVADYGVIRSKAPSIGAKNGDKPWICTWPSTTLEIFIYPIQNSSSPNPTSKPKSTTTSSVPNAYPTDGLHPYPKTVKFLERRLSDNNGQAYCRQVKIINNGLDMENVMDDLGNTIIIEIDEKPDPDQSNPYRQRLVRRTWNGPSASTSRDVLQLTPCGCLWWAAA
ncbi:hypothetical protein TARUN_1970 [Trichoderma arundinaceum]|uniref:DUF7820 domain-containing protein n=1 Tax=Trichoderma arundinaceum TaxID=490622 RepID=A0A395NW72_TRIAR|nr:hypothetical protein TARUN_1970 [Trichoderma arundinaceum]